MDRCKTELVPSRSRLPAIAATTKMTTTRLDRPTHRCGIVEPANDSGCIENRA